VTVDPGLPGSGWSADTDRMRIEPTAVDRPEPRLPDALALLAVYADEMVVGTARDTHGALARRAFGLVDRGAGAKAGGRSPRAVHDQVAAGVYGGLSRTLRAAATACELAGAAGIGPRLEDSSRGRALHAAVNGLLGDRLQDERPHLAIAAGVRVGGEEVATDPADLARAFPVASDRVVVFLHGLGEHEGHWEARRAELGGTYGSRLAETGWTPVYLRLNTGLPVAENGVALTSLMQRLSDGWPTDVRRIALVGHSMGGLVIRAGCAVATGADRPWTDRVSDVVTLGTPHLGADLALGVSHGARLLGVVPEIAAFGRILEHRSPGIRDLEHGLPDVPPLEHVRYRLVSAALGAERGPLGAVLGDLLVRRGSATGTVRRALRLFPRAELLHVPNADHFALLNHPDVQDALVKWLA
jgi:pimeloyl-ACP methyl ester carboxylesterase